MLKFELRVFVVAAMAVVLSTMIETAAFGGIRCSAACIIVHASSSLMCGRLLLLRSNETEHVSQDPLIVVTL